MAWSLCACSSNSKSTVATPSEPVWIHQPTRTVEGGYIIYVASSEARTLDQSQSHAQSAAIQNVANECSFAPKGTRLEDLYSNTAGILHRTFAKVAVSFQECEEAQHALDPAQIKVLANVAMTERVKHYQDAIDQEENEQNATEVESDQTGLNPALADQTIQNPVQFLVVRQQIAYAKEWVILAPATSYAANSRESAYFQQVVTPATTQVQNYQTQNPAVKNAQTGWSTLAVKPAVPALSGPGGRPLSGVRSSPAHDSLTSKKASAGNKRDSHFKKGKPPRPPAKTPRAGKRRERKKKSFEGSLER